MINYKKILNEHIVIHSEVDNVRNYTINCMKEAVKQAIPVILQEASNRVNDMPLLPTERPVCKGFITSLEKQLEEKLLK